MLNMPLLKLRVMTYHLWNRNDDQTRPKPYLILHSTYTKSKYKCITKPTALYILSLSSLRVFGRGGKIKGSHSSFYNNYIMVQPNPMELWFFWSQDILYGPLSPIQNIKLMIPNMLLIVYNMQNIFHENRDLCETQL